MRLLVATNLAPFVRGEAEILADRLVTELRAAGHVVDLVRLPLGESAGQVLDGTIAASLLDVENVDRVIALRYPAYLIDHEDVVVWLVHQFRQAYEPPPVGWALEPSVAPVLDAVRSADHAALLGATRRYAISPVIARRLWQHNHLTAEVLRTPPRSDATYRCAPSERFILALGCLSDANRQHLAVEAMRHAAPGYKLVVAGAPESRQVGLRIAQAIERGGLDDRVELIPRSITDDEKVDLLARCTASVYLPIEEDPYGCLCYEAAMSSKPTVTATDSGGTLTLVVDGVSGRVVEPEPEALAGAFDALVADAGRATEMGGEARRLANHLDLSWGRVVKELTR